MVELRFRAEEVSDYFVFNLMKSDYSIDIILVIQSFFLRNFGLLTDQVSEEPQTAVNLFIHDLIQICMSHIHLSISF